MKTYSAKPGQVNQNWLLIDADGMVLGRMATAISARLKGKHKPEYTANTDTGDFIVVINADKVKVTGNKAADKMYHFHSGYMGGMKSISFEKLQEKSPEKAIQLAVKGMLPRSPLGRAMIKKLKVYAGSNHPHSAQNPLPITL